MSPGEQELIRRIACDVAWKAWGTFYSWGGDDPDEGFDCSGLACEILKSVGLLARQERLTADGLTRRFASRIGLGATQIGDLVFWLDPIGKATHVEVIIACLTTELISMGASGGGPHVVTRQDAIAANAFVKARPVFARGGNIALARIIQPITGPF